MKVDSLVAAVRQVWEFLVPPLIELLVLLGVTTFILGLPAIQDASTWLSSKVATTSANRWPR